MLAAEVPIPASNFPVVPMETIFWNGGDPINKDSKITGLKSPEDEGAAKTIRLTNYHTDTIYPFLRSANDGRDPNDSKNGYYDPQDLHDREFRQYVGYYDANGGKLLGLPSGATIEFQVPLALWDGNNISLVTDGTYLTASGDAPGSKVFNYNDKAKISIASTDRVNNGTWVTYKANYPVGLTPFVMFYFDDNKPKTVPTDAPAQLAELTFRDPYLRKSGFIDDSFQSFPLLNYDLSYVNTLVAPAAMEASAVPITSGAVESNDLKFYPPKEDFGWHGSDKTFADFVPLIKDFVTNNSKSKAWIGSYFDGKGWPQYYNLNPDQYIIPSGANIFDNSPLDVHAGAPPVNVSNYDNNRWLLSSSGGGATKADANGVAESPTGTKVAVNFTSQDQRNLFAANVKSMIDSGQPINITVNNENKILGTLTGYDNSSSVRAYVMEAVGEGYSPDTKLIVKPRNGLGSGARGDVHVENGKIVSIGILPEWGGSGYTEPPELIFDDPGGQGRGAKYRADITGGTALVKVANGKTLPTVSASYSFSRTGTDYAATAITNLWYSWANYYVDQFKTYPSIQKANGSPVREQINGAGAKVLTNKITLKKLPPFPLAIGMTVNADSGIPKDKTTILKVEGNTIFLSQIPGEDVPDDQEYRFGKPVKLAIDAVSAKYTTPYTLKFPDSEAQKAKLFAGSVYETMAVQAVELPPASYLPTTMNVVAHVVKYYAKLPGYTRPWGNTLVAEVRDIVKSILRGVYDFIKEPDQSKWYPEPSQPAGGKSFNVYNLDPYVWFVHKVQGLTGYGFSIDDDVANPSATGPRDFDSNHLPSNLQIGFGGIEGKGELSNADKLRNNKEWFPATKWGRIETTATIGVWPDGPVAPQYKGYSFITLTGDDPVRTLNKIITPGPGEVGAYVFSDGYIVPGTRLIFFPDGVTGKTIILSQNAVSTASSIPIKINAEQFDIPSTPLKNANFDAPTQSVAPYYTVGPKGANVFWSFAGSSGIASTKSVYAKNNPPAAGTQVGFIQNLGAISQAVALSAGKAYAISFLVAQRQLDDGTVNKQTLEVKLGTKSIGKFASKTLNDGSYVLYTSDAFTVAQSGTYTVYVNGTNTNGGDNMALIDDVRITG